MNDTNRALNRIILLVVGLVLMGVGGAAVVALSWPAAADVWTMSVTTAVEWMQQAHAQTRIAEATTLSWFLTALLAALVLVIVIAVVVIARLGGGGSSVVIRAEGQSDAQGAITIESGFASDAITGSLSARDEILSSRVTARRVRGVDVLHVSVTPRRNASPRQVADTVTRLVDNLAVLTGRRTPTYVSIHSGVRARLAADNSLVT